jgi:hypothetical protein
MSDEKWFIIPDYDSDTDETDSYWGNVFTDDPGQGPSNEMANSFWVVRKSAYDAVVKERDELRLAKPNAGSTDTLTEKYQLRAEVERLKDTPGGKRIYGALNEIARLEADHAYGMKINAEMVDKLRSLTAAYKVLEDALNGLRSRWDKVGADKTTSYAILNEALAQAEKLRGGE